MITTLSLSHLANFMTQVNHLHFVGSSHNTKWRKILSNLKFLDSKRLSIQLLRRLIMDSRNQLQLLCPTSFSNILNEYKANTMHIWIQPNWLQILSYENELMNLQLTIVSIGIYWYYMPGSELSKIHNFIHSLCIYFRATVWSLIWASERRSDWLLSQETQLSLALKLGGSLSTHTTSAPLSSN